MSEPDTAPPKLVVQKFDKALHERGAFSCGIRPIDNFFQKSLAQHLKENLVVAYVGVIGIEVAGFYCLSAHAVQADLVPGRARTPAVPAWYLKAVAVDSRFQGRGYGNALMIHAMRKCAELSEQVGAAAIVLDVLRDEGYSRRLRFYEELGFVSLHDRENTDRLFIPIADVRVTLGLS